VRLTSGKLLVLEVKGQDTPRDQAKRQFLDEWVQAMNTQGGFGRWAAAVVRQPKEIRGVLASLAS
jgi:type III restriction enzyme